jgi:hypothetical protein
LVAGFAGYASRLAPSLSPFSRVGKKLPFLVDLSQHKPDPIDHFSAVFHGRYLLEVHEGKFPLRAVESDT